MSRIGKLPIKIPEKVEVSAGKGTIRVKGPLGELNTPLPDGIIFESGDGKIELKRQGETRQHRERHGLARALLQNCVLGVAKGWEKNLELVGVGYRAQSKDQELVFSLGYSHEVRYRLPDGVKAEVTDQTRISMTSIDKQKLGQAAAEIRSLRPPEPYKGKGIQYKNEKINRKAGKTGKAGKK